MTSARSTAPSRTLGSRALALGFPIRTAVELDRATPPSGIVESLDRDGVIEAYVAFLAGFDRSDLPLCQPGLVPSPPVAAFLRRIQDRRDLGLHAWATGQLSLLGDPTARAAVRSLIRSGRYYWVNELDERVLTDDFDPETMAWWIDELRSQCCLISTNSANLYDLLDPEVQWWQGASKASMTPYEWASSRWSPNPGRQLVWSPLLHRFLALDP